MQSCWLSQLLLLPTPKNGLGALKSRGGFPFLRAICRAQVLSPSTHGGLLPWRCFGLGRHLLEHPLAGQERGLGGGVDYPAHVQLYHGLLTCLFLPWTPPPPKKKRGGGRYKGGGLFKHRVPWGCIGFLGVAAATCKGLGHAGRGRAVHEQRGRAVN